MVQMFLKKDKIQRLVGHRPNKKYISNINILYKKIDKKGVNSLFNLNGFANLLSVGP